MCTGSAKYIWRQVLHLSQLRRLFAPGSHLTGEQLLALVLALFIRHRLTAGHPDLTERDRARASHPTEGGERMSAAFAAAFVPDLAPLTADLPKSPGKDTPIGWNFAAHGSGTAAVQSSQHNQRATAPAQLGAALLLVLLLLTCGLAFAHLVLDNGGGPGQRGFGRR